MTADLTEHAVLARGLIQDQRTAALATLEPGGGPFASYVNTVPTEDGSPLLLLSDLAVHSRNLARDPRASLLLVRQPEAGLPDVAAIRLTLTGKAFRDENPDFRSRFLASCPDAERYAAFADFAMYRFAIASGHLVAGFGRIVTIAAADLIVGGG